MNENSNEKESEYTVINIPVEKIRPNPYQPRRVFDNMALNDLSNSIKEYGVMQPITVRRLTEDSYELIAGERRLRASKIAGLDVIPSIIISVDDHVSAVLALIENLQRENLNFFEEAEGFYNLINDYNMTQEEVAKSVGKSQSTVANKLRLLKLDIDVRRTLLENQLTERHARALLKLPDVELQKKILDKIIKDNLNVKKSEELIKKTIDYIIDENKDDDKPNKKRIKRYIKDIRLFTNTVQKAVDVMKDAGVEVGYKVDKKEQGYEIMITIPYD